MRPAVTVIAVPPQGCSGISEEAARAVASSGVLAGEASLLAFFPQFPGRTAAGLDHLEELAGEHTVSVLLPAGAAFPAESLRIADRIGRGHVRIL